MVTSNLVERRNKRWQRLCVVALVIGVFYNWQCTSIPPFTIATLDSPVFRDGWFHRAETATFRGESLSQRVRDLWKDEKVTPAVAANLRDVVSAIDSRDRRRTVQIALSLLAAEPGPQPDDKGWEEFIADRNAYVLVALGNIALGEGWIDGADDLFRAALTVVHRVRGGSHKSVTREGASEGLARVDAMRGSYSSGLCWMARAHEEYFSGCGNCEASRASRAYTMQTVWEAAEEPFPSACRNLLDISVGRFAPQIGELNLGSGGMEKECAAVEATWALAMLYRQRGDAPACRKLLRKLAAPGRQRYRVAQLAVEQLNSTSFWGRAQPIASR